ncbi:MAG: YcaO-like family protein [Deltaproteobacteria bacterium]|nr:YcaO-like family protein [Deltaproteobacteria bacterium]
MKTVGNRLRSNITLKSNVKKHTIGLEKAISPAETVRNVKDALKRIDLDLVRDTIRIDSGRLGIPVYACHAGKDNRIPTPKTMGKGPSPDQSEASALMEMVERYSHAGYPRPETHRKGAMKDIVAQMLPPEDLFRVPNGSNTIRDEEMAEFESLPFSWVPAYSLVRKRDVLLPYEWFADIQGTNGLSAGNTLEETILQGLCEVVERHVCSVINTKRLRVPVIDFYSVRDPVARELLIKFSRNGIRLVCFDFSLDMGIPTVAGIAYDPASFPGSEVVFCAGTSTNPEKALIRVLTEIQQMALDYFKQDYYVGGILPKFRHPREAGYLFNEGDPVPIQSLPDVSSDDMLEEIEGCTTALQRIGFEPYVLDITHPVLRIPAVFVLMPGSELFEMSCHELNVTYFLGRRLEFIGRLDEAKEKFRLSMERHPNSRLHCNFEIANCLKYQKRWEEAIEAYKETFQYGPDRAMQMRILRSIEICMEKGAGETEAPKSSWRGRG